jgi:hypothetical protein
MCYCSISYSLATVKHARLLRYAGRVYRFVCGLIRLFAIGPLWLLVCCIRTFCIQAFDGLVFGLCLAVVSQSIYLLLQQWFVRCLRAAPLPKACCLSTVAPSMLPRFRIRTWHFALAVIWHVVHQPGQKPDPKQWLLLKSTLT